MKLRSSAFTGLILLFSSFLQAQNFQVPETQPSTKDEFVKSEKDFIAAAKWLEGTALAKVDDAARKKVNAWVVQWMVNSPTVTMEINASVSKIFDKNPDLLIVFMAGYGRYCLENNYSTDALKGNTAGINSAINCYNLGGDTKKDKALSKVIDADKEGKLEDWVKELMKSK
ncbi:MAG TPA: hypothetical protein VK492_07635 [Chitinophagaceae bacterium]|nr:hypothetical protein [Chitinophagaceae bacterium]